MEKFTRISHLVLTGMGMAELPPLFICIAVLQPSVHYSLVDDCVICLQVLSSRLVDMERDYLTLDKRYPRLFVPSTFSKVLLTYLPITI